MNGMKIIWKSLNEHWFLDGGEGTPNIAIISKDGIRPSYGTFPPPPFIEFDDSSYEESKRETILAYKKYLQEELDFLSIHFDDKGNIREP